MDSATIAKAVAATTIVVTTADKVIEMYLPNSRINSIFDVVINILNQIAQVFAPKKPPLR